MIVTVRFIIGSSNSNMTSGTMEVLDKPGYYVCDLAKLVEPMVAIIGQREF